MNTEQIRGLVASELIIIAMEQKTKKPSELNFDELIDVTTELVKKLTIQRVSKQRELLIDFFNFTLEKDYEGTEPNWIKTMVDDFLKSNL